MNKNKSEVFDSLFPNLTEADILAGNLRQQISKKIHQKRIDLKMSQKEFAKYMEVSQSVVSKWESYSYNFSIEDIAYFSIKLKLNISFTIND